MIAYEDLCRALDRYNRRLRGEEVPEEPVYAEVDAGYDVMETSDAGAEAGAADALSADYGDGYPDITAETELPEEGYEQQAYDQQAYEQQAYDQQAYEQQAYDPNTGQPVEGMTPDQVSSGHQQAYDSGAYEQQGYAQQPPTATPPPGYATPPPMPGTPPPEGHDPNRQ